MESVSKALDVGKKMIWGDASTSAAPTEENNTSTSREEPISGVTGEGTTLNPYDAGNREDQPEAPPPTEDSDPLKATTAAASQELKPDPNAPSEDTTIAATDGTTAPATNKEEAALKKEGDKLASDLADGGEKPTAASGTASSDVNSTATGETDLSKSKRKSKLGKLKQKLHIGKS